MSLDEKHRQLRQLLSSCEAVAIAFSGGVDSTLLAAVAAASLSPDRVLLLTAAFPFVPAAEIDATSRLATQLGTPHQIVHSRHMEQDRILANDAKRCYHCKLFLLQQLLARAEEQGIDTLFDGSNCDDLTDQRPGHQALQQLGVRSPLVEAGLSKQDVRALARQLKLSNWDKPAYSCLATRLATGQRIESSDLERIERCEKWLSQQGFSGHRVRLHGALARIEIDPQQFAKLLENDLRTALIEVLQKNGFDYSTLDLQGYRRGSMNIS